MSILKYFQCTTNKPLRFSYRSNFGIGLKRLFGNKGAISNILFIAGLFVVAFGAWLAYPPAGFLVAGMSMVFMGWLLS